MAEVTASHSLIVDMLGILGTKVSNLCPYGAKYAKRLI